MPEEDFSSQNVNLYIDTVDSRRASEDCLKVGLSDGSFFYVSYAFFRETGLGCGIPVDEELGHLLKEESLRWKCHRKALEYIAMREHSEWELGRKLRQKKYPPKTIETVLCRLKEVNLINDERFARSEIEKILAGKKESRCEAVAGLASKGLSSSAAQSLVRELYSIENEYKIAFGLAEKGLAAGKDFVKIKNYLLRKGFPYKEVKKVFSDIQNNEES